MKNYFENKVAIVTGGASGLGQALCMALGERGAKVVSVDIDQEGAQLVAENIRQAGGEALFGYLDVTVHENAQRIVKDVVNRYGRLDLMFNNAGTAIQGETRDLKAQHWRDVIDVNLYGVIYGAISAYEIMARQGNGQIINISSLAGLIPIPSEIPYCTSKWAVVGFSSSLRAEGVDLGVKVNLVCPGLMQTPIHTKAPKININLKQSTNSGMMKYSLSPAEAAEIILRGVERNRAIIIFPFYARLIWWLYRFNPKIFLVVARKLIRDFRKIRVVQ